MINLHPKLPHAPLDRRPSFRIQHLRSSIAAAALAAVLASSAIAFAGTSEAPTLAAAAGNLTPEAAQAAPQLPNFVSLVKTVKPAVVSVRVRSDELSQVVSEGGSPFEGTPLERFFNDRQRAQQSPRHVRQALGSGFLISADGYIVTNNHVIDHANKVQVATDDGSIFDAKVIGTDAKTDLALLKVEGRTDFPFVKFGDKKPDIGEWVVAMGNPFGLGGTVTAGIVSAQGRNIGSGPYDDFLQIDAAVNRGNSGGPTFNMDGGVVGVNTAIYSPSGGSVGIAFDIPASTASWVIDQLKSHGAVERGWLGVNVQAVNKSIADGLGLQKPEGVLVAKAEPASPAAKAGLKAGDVILSINGASVQNPRDLARKIATIAPNSNVTVAYVRDGGQQTAQVMLAKMQDTRTPRLASKDDHTDHTGKLGITVAPASEIDGAGDSGLAVLQVEPDGKAAELGLSAGDVMVKAGDKQLGNAGDFNQALASAATKGKATVLVLVRRGDLQRYVAMPVTNG